MLKRLESQYVCAKMHLAELLGAEKWFRLVYSLPCNYFKGLSSIVQVLFKYFEMPVRIINSA